MTQIKISSLIFIMMLPSVFCQQKEATFYFYKGQDFGSEAIFNPLTVILNGGFGILQISNRSNRIDDLDFRTGIKNVTYNLSHPFETISEYGWKNFFNREVFPTSFRLENAQYYPNYTLHLIGGGFTYRAFWEWYKWHDFSFPRIWAFTSWLTYHFLNEVVENNRFEGPNVDPIADIYIFNTLGLLLFSSEKVVRFFGNTLHMRDWSFMPCYAPWSNTIENIGQSFVMKIQLPRLNAWSFFGHWGVHGMGGVSYRYNENNSLSIGGGLVAKELVEVDDTDDVRSQTTNLVWTLGFFFDRSNSLLASLILSGTKGYKARLNIYPGLIQIGRLSPGFFVNLREDNRFVVGFQMQFLPCGLAYGSR